MPFEWGEVTVAETPPSLTRREWEIARLAGQGLTCREIAEALSVSFFTVRTHLLHVYAKCGAHNRVQMLHKLRPRLSCQTSFV